MGGANSQQSYLNSMEGRQQLAWQHEETNGVGLTVYEKLDGTQVACQPFSLAYIQIYAKKVQTSSCRNRSHISRKSYRRTLFISRPERGPAEQSHSLSLHHCWGYIISMLAAQAHCGSYRTQEKKESSPLPARSCCRWPPHWHLKSCKTQRK